MSDLAGLERAAYGRASDRVDRMIGALRALAIGTLVEDQANALPAPAEQSAVITRMAAAIAAILAEPTLTLTEKQHNQMFVLAPNLTRLFQVAGFDGTDFILRALGREDGDIPAAVLAERPMLISLDSTIDWTPELVATLEPSLALQAIAQLASTNPVMTLKGQERRDDLLEQALSMPDAIFPRTPDHLVLLTSAWMLCSYAGTPGKHRLKQLFNPTLRSMAQGIGFAEIALPAERTRKARPRILFASEIMHSKHVQYRYFGQYLRQLRTRFEIVLLTELREVDDAVRALFDSVLTFDRSQSDYLADIYAMIINAAPDILFYPSVGMRHWGPLFANLRLAPIQLTALGHSASTFCDTIDYYLLEEGYVSDPALFGETVLTVPDDSLIFERMPGFTPPAPVIRENPAALRVVLPSNLLKLNPSFLATIAKIRAATKRPLEIHFLPNAKDLELASLKKIAHRVLPGARVHNIVPYERYLNILSSCDLNLSPFPFGGLHSVVDSLRQGVPVVAMECPEPHGRPDAMLLRRLGMPDWLIATTEEEYIAAALRVIEDDALRVALSRQALAIDVGAVMFGDATTPLRTEIVDTLWWLYENHERAQADGRKLWSLADRHAFSAT
jgi:hypothetical protein